MHRSSSTTSLGSPVRGQVANPGVQSNFVPSLLAPIAEPRARRLDPRRESITSSTAEDSNADRISLLTANDHPIGVQSQRRDVTASNFAVDGKDLYLKILLDKKVKEFFPPPIPELGPKVSLPPGLGGVPPQRQKRSKSAQAPAAPIASATGAPSAFDLKDWRPAGTLVAHLVEHTAGINAIKIAADNSFFATCSDDKTVKIWDTMRLERNVTNRARLTYSGHEGKVKALTFCENTHTLASASDDGSIHVCRIEVVKTGTANRYTGYHLIRTLHLENDHAVLLDHYESETQSNLVYATARGRLCGFDLRTMTESWTLQVPPYYGHVTAMLLDPRRVFLVTGTHRGVFTIWDLRFGVRVKSFVHPSRSRIITMRWWPAAGRGAPPYLAAAVDGNTNEISIWNVESAECTQVWCAIAGAPAGTDVEKQMQDIYGDGLKAVLPPEIDDFLRSKKTGASSEARGAGASELCINAFEAMPETGYILCCGSDRKIRLLATDAPDTSYVVVGLQSNEARPRYSSHIYGKIAFNFEYTPTHHFTPDPFETTILQPETGPSPPGARLHHLDTATMAVAPLPAPQTHPLGSPAPAVSSTTEMQSLG
ncbi:Serine/threonine-protein kinase [Thoreauomyces humboldtii]|nr:Serine/threonine-protein kinase [Thoreauomyces humboldtii]